MRCGVLQSTDVLQATKTAIGEQRPNDQADLKECGKQGRASNPKVRVRHRIGQVMYKKCVHNTI